MGVQAVPLQNFKAFVIDGSTNRELPGLASVSASGGEADVASIEGFDGTFQIPGPVGVPTLSLTISRFLPQHQTMRYIRRRAIAGDAMQWQFQTMRELLFGDLEDTGQPRGEGLMAAITKDAGVVTLTGGNVPDDEIGPGTVLRVKATDYVIDRMVGDAWVVDPAPTANVAAMPAAFIRPSLRLGPFTAKAQAYGAFEAASGGVLASSLQLAPSTALPDWVLGPIK